MFKLFTHVKSNVNTNNKFITNTNQHNGIIMDTSQIIFTKLNVFICERFSVKILIFTK